MATSDAGLSSLTLATYSTNTYYSTYFPATGSYLTGSNAIFNVSSTTVVWNFECWVYPVAGTGYFFGIGSGSAFGNSVAITYGGQVANKFSLMQGNGSSNPVILTTTNTYALGNWYHVAVSRTSAGVLRIFVNGVQDATVTYNTAAVATGTTFVINGLNDNNGLGNNGGNFYLSNLRFMVGAATPLYTANFNVPSTQLTAIANTSLLACNTINFKVDGSVNNLTITSAGSVSFRQFTPILQANANVTLSPTFSTSTTSYTFSAPSNIVAISLTPTANDATYSSIKFNSNVSLTSGQSTIASSAPSFTSGYSENFINGSLQYANSTPVSVANYSWTVELWVYPTSYTAQNTLFAKRVASSTTTSYQGYLAATTGIIGFYQGTLYPSGYAVPLNQWSHVAYTYDGNNITIYVNGSRVYILNILLGADVAGPLQIGGAIGYTEWTVGNISNFRMVKGYVIYTGNFTVPTSPLGLTQSASTNIRAITGGPTTQGSLYLKGASSQWVSFPAGAGTSGDLGAGDFTLECWTYLYSRITLYPTIFDNAGALGQPNRVLFTAGHNSVDTTKYNLFVGGGSQTNFSTSVIYNSWVHIALVRVGTIITLYVNGKADATTITSSTNLFGITTAYVGGSQGDAANCSLNGLISNFRIVKGTAQYTQNFIPSGVPFTVAGNTTFLALQTNITSDASSLNSTITASGSPSFVLFNPYTGTSSLVQPNSNSVSLPGSTEINFGSNSGFAFKGNPYTVEFWVYPNIATSTYGSTNGPILVFNDTTGGWGIWDQNANGVGNGIVISARAGLNILGSATSLTVGAWNHVVAVRAGLFANQTSIFLNGTRIANGTDGTNWTVTGPLKIGGISTAGYYLNGYMSNVRVVNGYAVYDPSQITLNVPKSPLVAITNTQLLALQTTITADASTNNITATTSGSPVLSTTVSPFTIYGSGSTQFLSTALAYQQVSSAYSPALSLGQGQNNFTAEAWVYLNGTPPAAPGWYIIQKGTGATTGLEWSFSITSSGLYFQTASGVPTGTTTSTAFTANIIQGQWMHLALTKVGTNVNFYFNGVYTGTVNGVNNLLYTAQSASYITIANSQNSATTAFNGYISNARVVYGKALYTVNYDVGFTPSTTPFNPTQSATSSVASIDNASSYVVNNGSSVYFNNSNDFLTFPEPASSYYSVYYNPGNNLIVSSATGFGTAFNIGTNDFTIETWFFMNDNGYSNMTDSLRNQCLLSMLSSSGPQNGWSLIIFSNNNVTAGNAGIGLNNYVNDTQTSLGRTTNPILLNTWYHVAITRISGTSRLFVNGVLLDTQTAGQNLTNSNNLGIAYSPQSGYGRFFFGYMSNTRIVNGIGLYSATFTPSTVPLTINSQGANPAQVSLLLHQNVSPIKDNSLYNFTITTGGTYSMVTNTPFLTPYDVTVEAWVLLGVAPTTRGWIINNNATSTGYFGVAIEANRAVTVWSDNNATAAIQSNNVFPLYVWTHLAVVYTNNLIAIYINGVRDATVTKTTVWQAATLGTVYIGRQASAAAQYFPGYITNLRLVYGTAVYTSKFTVPTSPLTAIPNTVFLGLQSSATLDNSFNNATITKGAGATGLILAPLTSPFSTYIPTVTNGNSIGFNGAGANDSLQIATGYVTSTQLPGDFTIECWVFLTNSSVIAYLLDTRASTSDAGWLWAISSGQLSFSVGNAGAYLTSTANLLAINTWYHVAITRQNGTLKHWVNGIQDTVTTANNTIDYGLRGQISPVIGRGVNAAYTNGYVSNFRFTIGTAIYIGNFTPSVTPYVLTSPSSTNTLAVNSVTTYPSINNPNGFNYSGSCYFGGNISIGYISTPNSNIGRFELAAYDFTIEAWFYSTAATSTQTIVSAASTSTSDFAWRLYLGKSAIGSSGTLNFETYTGFTTTILYSYSSTLTINNYQWYHVAVVRTGNILTTYLNGLSACTIFIPVSQQYFGSTGTTTTPSIGSQFVSAGSYTNTFLGYISNVRIIKGYAVYTGNFIPSTSPLTNTQNIINNSNTITGTVTSLLALQNSTTSDASSNNLTLTATGSPSVSSTVVPYLPTTTGYSTYFDGNTYLILSYSGTLNPYISDFTVETWIYFPSVASLATSSMEIISQWHTSADAGDWFLYYRYDLSRWEFAASTTGAVGGLQRSYNTTVPIANQWYHIAGVKFGSTISCYVNGVKGTDATIAAVYNSTNGILIGANVTATNKLTGYLSNLRIVKGIAVYTGNFTVPTNALGLSQTSGTNIQAIPSANSTYYNSFNGSSQYLTTFSTSNFAFPAGTDFTVEFWFNTNNPGVAGSLVGNGDASSNGWAIWYNGAGVINFQTYSASIKGISVTISTNVWYHYALVRIGTTINVYLNGVVQGSAVTNNTSFTASTAAMAIGYISNINPAFFNGSISNVRITKGVGVYTANFAVPSGPLTATQSSGTNINAITTGQTVLLTCQSSSIIDNGTSLLPITNWNGVIISQTPVIFTYTQLLMFQTTAPIYDASLTGNGNNYQMTVSGTPVTSPANMAYAPFASSNGRSVFFTGSSQYIQAPSNNVFTFGSSNDFTIEGWIYLASGTSSGTLYDSRTGLTTLSPQVYIQSNIVNYAVAGVSVINSTTILPLSTTTWYHIAVVRISNITKLYVNGIQVGNNYTDTNNYVIGAPYIGTGYNSSNPLNGYISNLRVVNGTGVYSNSFFTPIAALTSTQTSSSSTIALNSSIPSLGSSVYFNGANDYMKLPSSVTDMGVNDFTIELYYYPTSLSAISTLLGQYTAATTALGYWNIQVTTAGIITVYYNGSTNFTASTAILANEWVHIALVRASGTITLYVNGASYGTVSFGSQFGLTSVGSPLYIGATQLSGPTQYAVGYMSNLRIVKNIAVYTGAFTVPSSPLAITQNSGTNIAAITSSVSTSLLLFQNSPFTDNSGYNNTIMGFGVPLYTPMFSPSFFTYPTPTNGNSGYFNGSTSYLSLTQPTSAGTGDFTIEMWAYPTSLPASQYLLSTSTTGSTASTTNGYVSLNGTTQYLTVPSNNGFVFGTGDFTIECWVYTTVAATNGASTTDRFIFGAIGNTPSWSVYLQNGATLIPNFYSPTGSVASSISVATSTYTHIAVVRYSGNMYIYVNGNLGGTVANNTNYTASGTQYIGRADDANNKYFTGNISNLRVVKGTAVYTSSFIPPSSPLTATQLSGINISAISAGVAGTSGTQLLALQSALTTDASVNNLTLTAIGTPSFVTSGGPFTSPLSAGSFHLWIISSGVIRLAVDSAASSIDSVTPSVAKINTWTHIAIVRSSGIISMYVNGYKQATTLSKVTVFGGTDTLNVGRYQPITGSYFAGYITNVRFVYGSSSIYLGNPGTPLYTTPPYSAPLTAITNTTLLLLQSTLTKDNSTNNVTVTNTGVVLSTFTNPYTMMKLPVVLTAQTTRDVASASFKDSSIYNATFTSGSLLYASYQPTVSPFGVAPVFLLGQSSLTRDNSINNYAISGYTGEPRINPYVTPFSGTTNAIAFNGSTQYITNTTNLYNSLGGDFTIEFFMMAGPQTASTGALILGRNNSYTTATNNNYYIMCSHPGVGHAGPTSLQTIQIYSYSYSTTNPVFVGTTPVCDSKWHHIAIVRINNIVKIYIDGVLDTSPNNSFTNTGTWDYSNYTIGSSNNDGTYSIAQLAYSGMLSNLRIINGTGIYTGVFTPPTSNLTLSQTSRTNVVAYNATSITSPTGYSWTFNGVASSYVTITPIPTLNFGLNDYTVEFWHFLSGRSASTTYPCLFGNYNSFTTGSLAMYAGHNSSVTTKYQLAFNGLSFPTNALISNSNIIYGKWTHIAVVRRSGVVYLYINGVLDSSSTLGNYVVYSPNNTWYIGGIGDNPSTSFITGYLSNFRVVNGIGLYSGTNSVTTNFTLPTSGFNTTQSSSSNIAAISTSLVTNGGAVWFSGGGSTGYQIVTYSSTYGSILNGGLLNLTVEAWVYLYVMPTSNTWTTGVSTLFSIAGSLSTGVHFVIGSSNLFIVVSNTSYIGYQHNMTAATWYHIAYVINNGITTTYVNGVALGSQINIPTIVSLPYSYQASLGTSASTAGYGLNGYISNLRVLKNIAVYTGNFTPSITNPLTNTQSIVTNVNAITGTNTALLALQNSTTTDASSNNLTLTVTGTPTINRKVYPAFQVAYARSAYFQSFPATSGTSSITVPSSISIYNYTVGTFTLECWIYPITFGGTYQIIISNDASTGLTPFGINSSGTIFYGYSPTASYGQTGVTSTVVTFNTWNHLAFVRSYTASGGTVTIYINGQSGYTGSNVIAYAQGVMRIGAEQNGTTFPFTGYISNVRLVNGIALYTSNFTVPTSTLSTTQSANINGSPSAAIAVNAYSGYFNGSQYIFVPSNSYQFVLGNNNFTIEFYFYYSASGNPLYFIDFRGSDSSPYPSIYVSNNILFYYTLGASKIASSTLLQYTWYHCALTRNNNITTLYVNGVAQGTYTDTNTYLLGTPSRPIIGTIYTGAGSNYLYGYISNMRIVNGSIVYTGAFTPPTTNLTSTQSSGTNINSISAPTTSDGYYDNYFTNSTGQYLSVPGSQYVFGTNPFTVECWVYALSLSANQVFVDNWVNTTFVPGQWTLYSLATTGYVVFAYATSTVAQTIITTTIGIPVGRWTHVAAVRTNTSANGFAIYVHGLLAQTATLSASIGINATSSIGILTSNKTSPLNGFISNVRLTNGVAVYTGIYSPQNSPLTKSQNSVSTSQSSLLVAQNATTTDASTNAFTLTAVGSPTLSITSPFVVPNGSSVFYNASTISYLNPSYGYTMTTGDFTVEVYAYCTNSSNFNYILSTNNANSDTGFYLGFATAGIFSYGGLTTNTSLDRNTSAALFYVWTHIAYVRINGVESLYFNGVLVSTSTRLLNFTSNSYMYIGYNPQVGGYFGGYLTNLRVVRGLGIYTGNFTTPTAPLTLTQSSSTNISAITGTVPTNGSSVTFNGSSYLSTAGSSQLAFNNSQYTIEFWVYFNALSVQQCFYDLRGATTTNIASFMQLLSNNTITYNVGTTVIITSSVTFSSPFWYHVAVVGTNQNTNGVTMYVNGVNVGTGTDNNTHSQYGLRIGQTGAGTNTFNGYISNFRIVVGTAVYASNFAVPSAPLTAITNTKILVLQNSTTTDASLVNYTLTATGTVTLSTTVSPFIYVPQVLMFQNATTNDASVNNFILNISSGSLTLYPLITPFAVSNGYSVYFTGSSQYLTVPSNSSLQFGTQDFTIEGWIYILNGNTGTLYDGRTSLTSTSPVIYINASTLYYAVGSTVVITGVTLSNSTWYHIAVARVSNNTSLYINGVQTGIIYSDNTVLNTVSTPAIGTGYSGTYPLNGYITNVRIVKNLAVYTNNFVVPTVPLTATVGGNIAAIPSLTTTNGYYACSFNSAQSQILSLPANAAFAFGTGAWTVEAWVYLVTLQESFVFDTRNSAATNGIGLRIDPTGTLYYSGSANNVLTTTAITTGSWYHVAWSYNGTTLTGYINGVSGGSATPGFNLTLNSPSIGRINYSVSGFLNGFISNLRVVKGIAVYTGNFTVPTGPLAATQSSGTNISAITGTATSLLTCQSSTIIDNSTFSATNIITNGNSVNTIIAIGLFGNNSGTTLLTSQSSTIVDNSAFPTTITNVGSTLTFPVINLFGVNNGVTQLLTLQNNTLVDNSYNGFTLGNSGSTTLVPANGLFNTGITQLLALQSSLTTDIGYYGVTLTPTGFTNLSTVSPFVATNGSSVSFNGSGNYLSITSNNVFTLSTNDFTIEGWIYLSGVTTTGTLYDSRTGATTVSPQVYINNNTVYYAVAGNIVITGSSLNTITWYHIAVVRISGVTKLYINGVKSGSNYTDSNSYVIGAPFIGQGYDNSYPLNGYISNLRVVNGTGAYVYNFTPQTTPLTSTQSSSASTQALTSLPTTGYYSAYLNGTNGYLSFNKTSYNVLAGSAFTIEAWVYFTNYPGSTGAYNITLLSTINASNNAGFLVNFTGSATAISGFGVYAWSTPTTITNAFSYNFSLATWYHVAAMRNSSGTFTCYVNGVSLGSYTNTSTWVDNTTYYIGYNGQASYPYYFPGFISNLRVTLGQANYISNFTPSTTALTITQSANTNGSPSLAIAQSTNTGYYNYVFTGNTAQYLGLPSTGFVFGTSPFTVECWVYMTSYTASSMVVDNFTNASSGSYAVGQWQIYLTFTTGTVNFLYATSASAVTTITTSNAVPLTTWTHIAAVRTSTSANGFIIYVNGVVGVTTTLSQSIGVVNTSGIGIQYQPKSAPFYGFISNMRFTYGVGVYSSTFIPQTTPLTNTQSGGGYVPASLMALQNATTTDASTNNLTLTVTGSPALTAYPSPFNGTSTQQYGMLLSTNLYAYTTTGISFGTGDFTIEFWVNPYYGGGTLIDFRPSGVSNYTGYMAISMAVVSYGIITFTAGGYAIASTINMTVGTWYHVAVARSGGVTRLFINGTQTGQAPTDVQTYSAATNRPVIGTDNSLNNGPSSGNYISTVRIVKGVGIYSANFTPPTTPLQATQYATSTIGAISAGQTELLALNSSNIATDSSGKNNSLSSNYSTSLVSLNLSPTPTNGSSVYFSGSTQYINAPSNALFTFGTNNFTIEGWIYLYTSATAGTLFDNRTGATTVSPQIYITGSTIYYAVGGTVAITGSSVSTFTWYHIAVVKSSGSTKLYVNGTQSGSTYTDSNNYVIGSPYIGTGYASSNPLNGFISNLRVVNGTAAYTTSFTPSTTPLTTSISSGGSIVSISAATTSVGYYATSFNGTNQYLTIPYVTSSFDWWTTDFTIEAWVMPTTLAGWSIVSTNNIPCMVSNSQYNNNGNYWAFGPLTDGTVRFYYYTGAQQVVTSSATVTVGQWNHIAMTKTSAGIRIWVNGVGTTAVAIVSTPLSNPNQPLVVGAYFNTYINGFVSNLRITRGVAVYTGTPFTVPTGPLSATQSTGTNIAAITAPTTSNGYYAYAFNGNSGSDITVPVSSNYAFGTGDFTVEFFINTTDITGGCVVPSTTQGTGYWALYFSAGNMVWQSAFGLSNAWIYAATTTILNGSWNHVAISRASGSTKLFVNGVLAATNADATNYTWSPNGASGLQIMSDTNRGASGSNTGTLYGSLSNLRITKGVAVYTGAFTVPTGPLAATQGSGTNISAITGTAVILLTAQSSTFVDNSTFNNTITNSSGFTITSIAYGLFNNTGVSLLTAQNATSIDNSINSTTITNNGAALNSVAFGLFNNTGVSLLTAQNATFVDNSVNGVTITNSAQPVTSAQVYGLFGTSITALLALQNSLTTDTSIYNNVLTPANLATGGVALEKSFSPLGGYNVPSFLTAQSALNTDNSINSMSSGIGVNFTVFQTTVTPFGAQTPTALLAAQTSTLLNDATGSYTLVNQGTAIPVSTINGPFNSDTPLLTLQGTLITDNSNTRSQMTVTGGGVAPTDSSPFTTSKSVTGLLLPYSYSDISVANSPIANGTTAPQSVTVYNPFTIPSSLVSVLALQTSTINSESSINFNTFTTSGTAPTSSTLSPFGTYNSNGILILNTASTLGITANIVNFANLLVTANDNVTTNTYSISVTALNTNNIGNRVTLDTGYNPPAINIALSIDPNTSNVSLSEAVYSTPITPNIGNIIITQWMLQDYRNSTLVANTQTGAANILINEGFNSNLSEPLINSPIPLSGNIVLTQWMFQDQRNSTLTANASTGGANLYVTYVGNIANINLVEPISNVFLPNVFSTPRVIADVGTNPPSSSVTFALYPTYSYTDGVFITASNVQSGGSGSSFTSNQQVWY